MTTKKSSVLGINHVQVGAPPGSEAAARRFYSELLGLAEIAKPANLAGRGGAWFQAGSNQIHIGIETDFNVVAAKKAHVAFEVDDLVALHQALKEAAGTTAFDADVPGYRRFHARDPFGNRIEFIQRDH